MENIKRYPDLFKECERLNMSVYLVRRKLGHNSVSYKLRKLYAEAWGKEIEARHYRDYLSHFGIEVCPKCGGFGGYEGWPGFTCYKCNGKGQIKIEGKEISQ